MKAKVQKWGNSLAVRIPRPFAAEIGIEENSSVEIYLQKGKLILIPKKKLTLDELVAGITDENRHEEVNYSDPVGNEAW